MKKQKLFFLLMVMSLFALVLAACSDSSDNESSEEDTATKETETADEQQYPITVKQAFGETIIEEKPERVATIAWANHDVALALGVVPVGFSAANYGVQDGSGLLPWTAEKLKELGEENPNIFQDTDGLDFEAIADSDPDVILAAYSGITQEEYDTLSEIAPVIAYKETPWVISWRDQITLNAQGMGMEKEGQQLIKDTEQLIQEKAAQYADIKGKTAVFAWFNTADLSNFSIYTPADPRGEFLTEVGMNFSESILKQIEDEKSFYVQFSAENADALNDVDIFITYGSEETLPALQADPILGKVPAIAAGNVVVITDNTPLAAAGNPNPLSIQYTIDEYLSLISDVAKNVQ